MKGNNRVVGTRPVELTRFAGPVAGILLTAVSASTETPPSTAPPPRVTGPISGGEHGRPFSALSQVPTGYVEEEYFYAGTATAYDKTGTWDAAGRWVATASAAADYRVRLLVRRPTDAHRFNGTVVVEWLNVSAQFEGAADYAHMNEEIVRGGYAWVGVGAQAVGIDAPVTGLRAWDAARYRTLAHPGDAYAYSIFSQGGEALRHPKGVDPLGGLTVRAMLATGRSQSAQRLLTYINAVHPVAQVYDGFLLHSRGALSAALFGGPAGAVPQGARVRADIDVPVLNVETEYDVVRGLGYLVRQEPSTHIRRWEIAGASHTETPRWVVDVPPSLDLGPGCQDPVNAAPQHAVIKAALRALMQWVREGHAPPQSPVIELADPVGPSRSPVRDQHGNAKGGIRLPELEAPTAVLDGLANTAAATAPGAVNYCSTYGHTRPLDPQTLAWLYPTHDDFVRRFNQAVDAVLHAGYWLAPEADQARRAAEASHIGR